MSAFQLYILAADCDFYEGPCESLIVPMLEGQYGILSNHSNMLGAIVPGMLTYKLPDQEPKIAAVSSGIVKVENNTVMVLVEAAERPEDIDVNRAKRAADEAREQMLQKRSIQEYRAAQADLARAMSRLKISKNYDIK